MGDEVEVSIAILTKNAGPLFERVLEAIFAQDYAGPFEVVVVDSGSTDGTLEVLGRYPVRLHRIPPGEFDFGSTRDLAYSMARGRWIATLSQDVVPAGPHWLRKLVEPFADQGVAAVQGNCLLPEPADEVFFWWRIGKFYFTREVGRWMRTYGFGFSNTCSAVRRDVWEKVRIGPAPMSEDRMLQKRLVERGYRLAYAHEATAFHGHDYLSLRDLAHRCENEGLGSRCTGIRYSLVDMLLDLLRPDMQRQMLAALRRGVIRRPSEILFPVVRPIFVFKGNRWGRRYRE